MSGKRKTEYTFPETGSEIDSPLPKLPRQDEVKSPPKLSLLRASQIYNESPAISMKKNKFVYTSSKMGANGSKKQNEVNSPPRTVYQPPLKSIKRGSTIGAKDSTVTNSLTKYKARRSVFNLIGKLTPGMLQSIGERRKGLIANESVSPTRSKTVREFKA